MTIRIISMAAMAIFIPAFMHGAHDARADEPRALTQVARYVPCDQARARATGETPTDDQTPPRDLYPINRETIPVVRTPPVLVEPNREPIARPRPIFRKGIAPQVIEFIRRVRARIAEAQEYPPNAIKLGLQGTATVKLELNPDGHARAIRIRKSSGHSMLDDAALEAVQKALPMKPPPEAGNHPLELDIPISFALR